MKLDRPRAVVLVGIVVALVAGVLASPWHARISDGPNVVVILSDDQSIGSIPHDPPPMPFLQSQVTDPSGHWIDFTNAFLNDPLCCPSRASILTGQYAHDTGVLKNAYGDAFREDSTIATWLHDVGYYTGFFGKYINQYPFDRAPYVPPGWDRWAAKVRGGPETTYFNYSLVGDGGRVTSYDSAPQDYMPDVLAEKAVQFIDDAPGGRPFFMEYAPPDPHAPWVPAPRHVAAFDGQPVDIRPNVNEKNVSDKPRWVQGLPLMPQSRLASLVEDQRKEFDALLAMDDAVRSIYDALQARGVLGDTVIIYLTDNGYSYGSHRWIAKRCEYEECTATPFFVRYPGAVARQDPYPVSNVDIAPTVAALAGTTPGIREDGIDLTPILSDATASPSRPGVLIEWPGDDVVPAYFGIRTEDYLYVELATGERELYDLTGAIGEADPYELHNVVSDPRYRAVREQLASELEQLKGAPLQWVRTPTGPVPVSSVATVTPSASPSATPSPAPTSTPAPASTSPTPTPSS